VASDLRAVDPAALPAEAEAAPDKFAGKWGGK
jgi:hypothetical protein